MVAKKAGKTVQQIRRENLLKLADEYEGGRAEIARLADTTKSYLTQVTNDAPSYGARGIGSALARKIELGCKKPVGWLDAEHNEVDAGEAELSLIYARLSPAQREVLLSEAKKLAKKKS